MPPTHGHAEEQDGIVDETCLLFLSQISAAPKGALCGYVAFSVSPN